MSQPQLFGSMNLRKLALSSVSLTAAAVLLLTAAGCKTQTEDDDATNVFIEIVNMGASSTDFQGAGPEATDLFSDVCFANDDTPPCVTFNDNGFVTMIAIAKDRSQTMSLVNDVVFERYRVTYIRADGRNVPGVDVPYPFDGAANFSVPIDGSEVNRSFVVVRHQAKRESPLVEIAQNGTGIISVLAQVEFFGKDITGRSIKVTGYINITFGDFANE